MRACRWRCAATVSAGYAWSCQPCGLASAAVLQAKDREKQELLEMCNELMTRLEREGLSSS